MFFDDLPVGFRRETAAKTVTEAEIIDFAKQWDAQYFHTDPEAAKASPYGGLIASGFHTLLIGFNLVLGADIWNESSMGSPGMEHVRWIRPVRPGDALRLTIEVTASTPSQSRPDRGRTHFRHLLWNQHDEVVMEFDSVVILARRPG
jgi:acyl dehydratase